MNESRDNVAISSSSTATFYASSDSTGGNANLNAANNLHKAPKKTRRLNASKANSVNALCLATRCPPTTCSTKVLLAMSTMARQTQATNELNELLTVHQV